jgi:large subunit ribosomal protein L13
MRVVDAEGCILGRMAVEVAKLARNGEEVVVVNSEKAIITGKREVVLKRYLERRQRGHPFKGPFFPRTPEKIVRRAVRGMVGYKSPEGKAAFERVKTYVGVPESLQGKKAEKVGKQAKDTNCGFIFVGEVSKYLGYDYGQ